MDSVERHEAQEQLVASLLQGQQQIFFFPDGLLGFSAYRRFTLSRYQSADGNESPFFVLQAVDGDLSFPLVSPRLLMPDYHLSLSPEALVKLATDTTSDLVALAIVTLRPRLEDITANLQGPLLLNPIARLGLQIVAEQYPVRYPLLTHQPVPKKRSRRVNQKR